MAERALRSGSDEGEEAIAKAGRADARAVLVRVVYALHLCAAGASVPLLASAIGVVLSIWTVPCPSLPIDHMAVLDGMRRRKQRFMSHDVFFCRTTIKKLEAFNAM
ncbi:hypothetical protein B296_00014939 [Ensete ventricosum]|uniref:Uncharacterized protein n=1 Tax=Ensete ventricosum TaxID=4639 RepID=A0A427B6V1_ENSVE|nr:hypothetical protein B296_00014939 [Ensete ventricosum]